MKTKLSLCFFLLIAHLSLLTAQVPQGFNYQAIARDGAGTILPNTPLQAMLYVQSLSTGGTIFWKELHASVTTNSFGLFTLNVGTGVRQPASTVATFDLIDWRVTPKYLKTEIYYSGSWKDMGTSQLLTVPYAMVAEDLAGSVKKLAVLGETSGLEEALFEVKNKDGQTVFAVYNEGVRVYVSNGSKAIKGGFAVGGFGTDKAETTKYLFVGKDSVRIYLDTNPLTKGKKSGFAVGGYDLTKGTVQDYLDISADSVRIYIDSDPSTKKIKGGFAVGGYDMTKGGSPAPYLNVTSATSAELVKNESRVMWYPKKSALLAGELNIPNSDSVGTYSMSLGYKNIARGSYSQAMGFQSSARGPYSTAIGYEAVADTNSFAFGKNAKATGKNSFAFGSKGVDASGNELSTFTEASAKFSFAFGLGAKAKALGAFVLGTNCIASGKFSTAAGFNSSASGLNSTAMGVNNTASGEVSFAMGSGNTSTGQYAFSFGANNQATGVASVALGLSNTVNGDQAIIGGYSNSGTGFGAFAMGSYNVVNGDGSIAAGNSNQCTATTSAAFGTGNISSGSRSFAIGDHSTANATNAFATGYKTLAHGDNSMTIGYQDTTLGTGTLATGYRTSAGGSYSFASGYQSRARSFGSFAIGRFNTPYLYNAANSPTAWYSNDFLFVVGNGTNATTGVNDALVLYKNGNMKVDGSFYPNDDGVPSLGLSSNRWAVVYAVNATIQTSDRRYKKDIADIGYGLDAVLKLHPVSFRWIDFPDQGTKFGLIAQEVQPLIKEIVDVGDDAGNTLGLSYSEFIPILIRSIQEQQEIIVEQKIKNVELEKKLEDINRRLELLEAKK